MSSSTEFTPEELQTIGETYQKFYARTGEAQIKTSIQLQALLATLEIKLASEADVTKLFNKFADIKGYMTFHDLIGSLQDIKVMGLQADGMEDEDENIDEIDCDKALADVGLPEGALSDLAASVISEVGAKSLRSRRATMAADALAMSKYSDDLESDNDAVELCTAATTRKLVSALGKSEAPKLSKTTANPYKAFRKSATVVSSGATSALAGSLHAEVLLMRNLRSRNVSHKIQTPLPLPNFYGRIRRSPDAEIDGHPGHSPLQVSQPLKATRSGSLVGEQKGRRRSELLENTQLFSCSKGSASAYTGTVSLVDIDDDNDIAQQDNSGPTPVARPFSKQLLQPRSTDVVCRGSLRKTHRAMTPQTAPRGFKESSYIAVSRNAEVNGLKRAASAEPTKKLVPTTRIVKRILDVDKAVFNPKKQGAPATINRILGAIESEADSLYYAGSERARLKSPYTGVSRLVN